MKVIRLYEYYDQRELPYYFFKIRNSSEPEIDSQGELIATFELKRKTYLHLSPSGVETALSCVPRREGAIRRIQLIIENVEKFGDDAPSWIYESFADEEYGRDGTPKPYDTTAEEFAESLYKESYRRKDGVEYVNWAAIEKTAPLNPSVSTTDNKNIAPVETQKSKPIVVANIPKAEEPKHLEPTPEPEAPPVIRKPETPDILDFMDKTNKELKKINEKLDWEDQRYFLTRSIEDSLSRQSEIDRKRIDHLINYILSDSEILDNLDFRIHVHEIEEECEKNYKQIYGNIGDLFKLVEPMKESVSEIEDDVTEAYKTLNSHARYVEGIHARIDELAIKLEESEQRNADLVAKLEETNKKVSDLRGNVIALILAALITVMFLVLTR